MQDSLYLISALPDLHRKAFPSITFTAIQGQCCDIALDSDDNILLTAPTGCDKTGIAEITDVSTLVNAFRPMSIFYVSPSRSLSRQQVRDWQSQFEQSNLSIQR
jgi:replicative superfamily II helicase